MSNELLIQWIEAGQTEIPTLLLKYYRKLGLNNDEFVLIMQLKSHMDRGNYFPDLKEIAQAMGISKNNAFKAVHQLMQKKLLSIETKEDDKGITEDAYSLMLLWEKLMVLMKQKETVVEVKQEEEEEKNLYSIFEAEFGRPLSPMEIESLVMWVEEDDFSNEFWEMDEALTYVTYETDDINKNIERGRIKRSVWSINTKPFKGSHFAPYPEKLIETPIKACCPIDGIVLDMFFGSGTTGKVAKDLNRNFLGIELNQEFIEIAKERIGDV